ncbi:MAG: LD-carboxypeptidase [Rhodothermales bacterium]
MDKFNSSANASRRGFLKLSALAIPFVKGAGVGKEVMKDMQVIKPASLQHGDTVGLVSPAGVTYESVQIDIIEETLDMLGLKMKAGQYMMDRWGYFAGTDEHRAADINNMFADEHVDAIFALHGGWGAARALPFLDYEVIRANPKIFMGYSDITALLIAIYANTGLITFHGPNGNSVWNEFSANYVKKLLFDADSVLYKNPEEKGDALVVVNDRIRTISSGKARGKLVGGNLTVLTSIIGSDQLPNWEGHILFLEDIGEAIYRIDRMLTQLKLSGVLDQIAGFVFGNCNDCTANSGYNSFTLNEILDHHIKPLGIPAWTGSMIGHIENKFTIPIGVEAEINADLGQIKLLEPAVFKP